MPSKPLAAIAAAATLASAQLLGARFRPDLQPDTWRWYQRLDKSQLTPPGPVFGVAWTLIDTLLAYSGYRLFLAKPAKPRTAALLFWAANVLSIPAYTFAFFGRRRLDEATIVSSGMLASSAALVASAATVDKRAAWSAAPLAGWLLFALYLQEEVWRRNRST